MRQFSVGGVGVTGVAGAERGRRGLFHTCKRIGCSVSNAGPLKIFKESDTVRGSRLEEDRPGRLLQQWIRCWMTWTWTQAVLTESAEAGSVGLGNGLSHRQGRGGRRGPSLRLWGLLMREDGINRGTEAEEQVWEWGGRGRVEGMETEEVAHGISFLWAPSGDGTRAEGLALSKSRQTLPLPWGGRAKAKGRGWLCRAAVGAQDPEG